MVQTMSREYLTDVELAELLQVTRGALSRWRRLDTGPPWVKISTGPNGAIRYRRRDVEEYLDRQTVRPNE